MFCRLKSQDGFTLAELVIALAVVGIMAGVFTATRSVVESAKVSSAVQAVETIASGAVQFTMFRPDGRYGGLSWSSITSQGLVPPDLMYPQWNNPWGGYYNVWADCGDSCFTVQLAYNVPRPAADRIRNTFSRRASTWQSNYTGCCAHVQLRFDK
ncbi:MAG: prepilin-type N-terminal cleavage/methylation domain-containing protein [Deltaproteobacteria bacterium]|nr:prepilin-type N-terminal cleavage/methylation domain-containing protein [Deltaproteobacteria bacterium]